MFRAKRRFTTAIAAVVMLTLCAGCSGGAVPAAAYPESVGAAVDLADNFLQDDTPPITPEPLPEPTPEPMPPTVPALLESGIYPYEVGQIMIVMYHGVFAEKPKNPYHRSIEDFQNDLQALYDGGYRLISMSDLIDNRISVPAGYTPVVLSFDDGLPTAFSLTADGAALVVTPDCAVDILTRFAEDHPDFGNTAVFYINGDTDSFRGAGNLSERLGWLVEHGYELGNHTYSHASLNTLDAEGIQAEIGGVEAVVRGALPGYEMRSLSYPNGIRPREELRGYALDGSDNGLAYHYALAVREGQSGASAAPNHVRFDPTNVPRARGSDGTDTDLWWSLGELEKHLERRYVSDGDPERITVPAEYEGNVNTDSLNGKELVLYQSERE